jgi:hypothetical protein
MPYDDKMKISELRKMLKEHRKTSIAPVSKMAKHQILMELDKFAATPSTQPSKAPVVVKEEKAVKVEKKMETDPGTSLPKPKKTKVAPTPLIQPEVSKKELDKSVEPKKEVARVKLIKGSKEARDFMASIRMKKTKKDDVS